MVTWRCCYQQRDFFCVREVTLPGRDLTEDLDSSLFPDEATQREFLQWYLHKYRDRKPDLIIAVGPSPIKLMSESHELLSPGTPIVFWEVRKSLHSRQSLTLTLPAVGE